MIIEEDLVCPDFVLPDFMAAVAVEKDVTPSLEDQVGEMLEAMNYKPLGCGLYMGGGHCIKVGETTVRFFPQMPTMPEQYHQDFLLMPHKMFFLETSRRYLGVQP